MLGGALSGRRRLSEEEGKGGRPSSQKKASPLGPLLSSIPSFRPWQWPCNEGGGEARAFPLVQNI